MKAPELTKERLEELVIKIIGYHEYVCGDGYRAGEIRQAIKLGWNELRKILKD